MIKAKLIIKGKPVLVFGLSEANLRRLRKREPIRFDLADLGIQPSVPVVIISGPDEAAMRAVLEEWLEMPPRSEDQEGPLEFRLTRKQAELLRHAAELDDASLTLPEEDWPVLNAAIATLEAGLL